MIVDDSISCHLTTRMIVDDSFLVSCFPHQHSQEFIFRKFFQQLKKKKKKKNEAGSRPLCGRQKFIHAKFCNLGDATFAMLTLGSCRCLILEAHDKLSLAITSFFAPFDHPINSGLTIGLACVHRDMKHAGSLESSKDPVRVAQDVAESNSSFLSALQTSQVLHISMNAQLSHEPIVL